MRRIVMADTQAIPCTTRVLSNQRAAGTVQVNKAEPSAGTACQDYVSISSLEQPKRHFPPVDQLPLAIATEFKDVLRKEKGFPGDTTLMRVAVAGDLAAAKALVAYGADVNARNSIGITPLMWAASKSQASMVQFLLEQGANANARAIDDYTALITAATVGDAASVQALLEYGADINARNRDGVTALMQAAFHSSGVATIRMLLDNGADVTLRDNEGNTALSRAVENGDAEVIELLKARRP